MTREVYQLSKSLSRQPWRLIKNMNAVELGPNEVHPEGFYKTYPKVTWDLAAERWTTVRGRSHVLLAWCDSCDWHYSEAVLAKPERLRIAEFIIECQHWYSCTAGQPQVSFDWLVGPFRYT